MSQHMRPRPLRRPPTVSVIIPCYNYGHYLEGAVESALDQAGVDVDVIVIDDASPDGSGEVAAKLADRDPRVRAVCHERNQGHIATYNEGLAMVESDYVVLLSADDLLVPDALSRATALMEAHPNVGFVYGHPLAFTDQAPDPKLDVRGWTIWSGQEWIEGRTRRGRNCIFCPEVVMRNSVQQAIGGYDPAQPHSGDFEMWLRASAVADVGRVNGANQAYYRIHPDSMQRTINAGHLTDLEGRRAAFESVLNSSDRPVPRGPALYTQACRALAVDALRRALADYDEGPGDRQATDELMAFARKVWPYAPSLREWKALQRRIRRPVVASVPVSVACSRVTRDLTGRVRWRRWRWSGV
jgi:hypothetical protein